MILSFRKNARNPMTSVLNVGVMTRNPVGNQIRSLQLQLDSEKKNVEILLSALEKQLPEVFAEYVRMKLASEESESPDMDMNQNIQQRIQGQTSRNSGQPVRTTGNQNTGNQNVRNPNVRF